MELKTPDEITELVASLIDFKDTVNLDGELIRQVPIFKQMQMLLSKQSKTHEELSLKMENLKLWKARYYDGRLAQTVYKESPLAHKPSTKSELDIMIKVDPDVVKLSSLISDSERCLQIIEDGLWQLRQRPKNIASIIEWRKYIETGM